MTYNCDVCGLPIEGEADGVLHGLETFGCAEPPTEGFAFWKWSDNISPEYRKGLGQVHKRCLGQKVREYLKYLGMGRLVLPGAKMILTREKLKGRI